MIVAFHFRVDEHEHGALYGETLQDRFLLCLREAPFRDVHLEIFTGDLLANQHMADEGKGENILRSLLGHDPRRWKSVDCDEFATALLSKRIYVIAVEGLAHRLEEYLDHRLSGDGSYLGCIEVDPANPVHWGFYRLSLIPQYRYLQDEVRFFYREFEEREGADTRDTGRAAGIERLGFNVTWEDIGVRHTIFDSYESFEQAARLAELDGYLSEHFARMADEILMRAASLEPRLKDELYAALRTFDRIQSPAEIAQVALSCRRFVEKLADALYPPRPERVEGRNVGIEAYRNRIWAYVKESLRGDQQRVVLANLEDLGNRVDRVDQLCQKGLHAQISLSDVRRLILALLGLAYDLLTLGPPVTRSPLGPYAGAIDDFARKTAKRSPSSGKNQKGDR